MKACCLATPPADRLTLTIGYTWGGDTLTGLCPPCAETANLEAQRIGAQSITVRPFLHVTKDEGRVIVESAS